MVLEDRANAIRQEEGGRGIQVGKEEIKILSTKKLLMNLQKHS